VPTRLVGTEGGTESADTDRGPAATRHAANARASRKKSNVFVRISFLERHTDFVFREPDLVHLLLVLVTDEPMAIIGPDRRLVWNGGLSSYYPWSDKREQSACSL